MRQEGEPSVEEILESIKRVIDRDSVRQEKDPAPTEAESPLQRSAFNLDPVDQDEAEEILDLSEAGAELEDEDDTTADTLTNAQAADAMRQSLAALAMLSEPPAKPQIVRSGETSLEGMVRDMLRPMLAQWLDANLPDMVERLVKAEIARIAGKKR
ncbi:DUF2497 domain-containing protein [Aurantiacibacter sediminis]|uniref:DUF2497 domain-containing protein n=1 Tax=Aurantiacibacter sediminis TaxID=2793064 RepID=A0ABS0N0D8_9SPHN|nr:DUF2497 domain-containing protein [Aurantiacibacter sediminis]MBH5321427.1 DUF2497 domain-containing protein [Aurantiacibacter sediminis]